MKRYLSYKMNNKNSKLPKKITEIKTQSIQSKQLKVFKKMQKKLISKTIFKLNNRNSKYNLE